MSVKKNFFYNLMYQMIIILTPLITTPYVSRVLGPEMLGEFAYTYSISSYFVLISFLGVKNYGSRSIARVRDSIKERSRMFYEIYVIQLFMSFVMLLLFLYIAFKSSSLLMLIQSLYIVGAALDVSWFYFGLEKFKFTAIRGATVKILSVILILLFVTETSDIYIYAVILSLANVISQLPLLLSLKSHVKIEKIVLRNIKNHIRPILLLFIPVLAISLYNIMDKILLGYFSSMEQTAYFESAEKIVNVPFGVIMALGTVMLPRTAYLLNNNQKEKSLYYLGISLKYIMILSIGMTFGIMGISRNFTPIFFGNQFKETDILIICISPIIIFKAWANVIRTQYLIPRNKDKEYIISVFLGALINICTNIILIPKYNALGTVIATLLAELTVALYQTYQVKKELPIIKYMLEVKEYFVIGIAMFFILRKIEELYYSGVKLLIIQISVGFIFYIIATMVVLFLKKQHKELLTFRRN